MENVHIHKLFENLDNKEVLSFIDSLNKANVLNVITGSSALYIQGNISRVPNDVDIYTTKEHLAHIADMWDEKVEKVSFYPVRWLKVKNDFDIDMIAQLECRFDDGRYYNFSFTPLVRGHCKKYEVRSVDITVVPAEEVLLLKLTAPRKKDGKDDMADVENYLKINKLNKEYFKSRAEEIGIQDLENISKYIK